MSNDSIERTREGAGGTVPASGTEGPCELRTVEDARAYVAAFRGVRAADPTRARSIAAFLAADELSVYFLEEFGRAAEGEEFAAARDLLCHRKLGIGFEDLTGIFAAAIRGAFAWLRDPFAREQAEGIRPRLIERIDECETQFALAFRAHRPALDEEIRDAATIDPYQLVLVFLDRAWRTLPVGETPETDAFVERGLSSEYEHAVETMYTLLAGKLMTGLLSLYAAAAPDPRS